MKKKWGLLLCCIFSVILLQPALRSHAQSKLEVHHKVKAPVSRFEVMDSNLQGLLGRLDQLMTRSHMLQKEQVIRVLLADKLSSAEVKHSGPVSVYAVWGKERYSLGSEGTLKASIDKEGTIRLIGISAKGPVVIDPQYQTELTFKGRVYNGVLYLIPSDRGMLVVEHINLEDYLLGVVGHEMSPSWPLEALKAQTVAARTFARMKMRDKGPNYDLCNKPSDQAYHGSGGDIPDRVRQAVEGTVGEVLTYHNNLFHTFYHANCGGHTLNGKVLTGRSSTIRPLQGVVCTTCSHSHNACWESTLPGEVIDNFVRENSALSEPVKSIRIEQTDEEGAGSSIKRAISLRFVTQTGSVVLKCSDLQKAVGAGKLKSCKIGGIAHNAAENSFTFNGCGFGHGVGMCQDGARGMAEQKHSYQDILSHYFPGSELVAM